ncbi:MAG: redoxin domain-containing protein [Planctomycetes bacterium]|nr:redoxin domain-containing protein [Planctomycetota bacterium]
MTKQTIRTTRIRAIALAVITAVAFLGCEDQQQKPAPKEKTKPKPKDAQTSTSNPIEDMGKAMNKAGKAIADGAGKVIEGTGKIVIDGGGKVVDGAGKVIGGAGVALGKAVGDVVVVTLGPDNSAPDFLLSDLNGNRIKLSDFRGRPVILIFCTTNYEPCVVEMKHLRDLQEKYADDGLKVLAIAMDWEGRAALRNFAKQMDLNYPVLWDNGRLFKEYTSLSRVPTTFFIDRKGNIWKKRVGFRSAMIITGGGQFLGSSMVEMDKDFEKDVIKLLGKKR